MNPLQGDGDGIRLLVRVQPRASRTELAGLHGDALRIRLAAPPVDGAANAELCRFLARSLGVPTRAVEIISGTTGRQKRVRVTGVELGPAATALGLPPP